jgi:GDSL-like Lipase/Acylhydrolase family
MSIDDYAGGPGRRAASLLWRNRDDDFPAWAGRDLTTRDPTARLVLLASDGATSATVAGEQLRRLRRLQRTPTLATVTMGGNDLLTAYGDATAARRAIRTVLDNGRLVLAGLRALMGPEAPIVVATVYDPSDGSGDAGRLGLPPCGLIEPNAWVPARSGPPFGRRWNERTPSKHDHMESASVTPPEQSSPVARMASGRAATTRPGSRSGQLVGARCVVRATCP